MSEIELTYEDLFEAATCVDRNIERINRVLETLKVDNVRALATWDGSSRATFEQIAQCCLVAYGQIPVELGKISITLRNTAIIIGEAEAAAARETERLFADQGKAIPR